MTIDFSWSRQDWLSLIRQFLEIIQNFFKEIGIDIFITSEDTASDTDA